MNCAEYKLPQNEPNAVDGSVFGTSDIDSIGIFAKNLTLIRVCISQKGKFYLDAIKYILINISSTNKMCNF